MDVAVWLRGLGLERYIKAFEDNDIDDPTLRSLTEADLADIGVTSVGHRRKLVEAIKALPEGAAAPDEAAHGTPPAERRQLTVLYCAMSTRSEQATGVEDDALREAVRSFHRTCTDVVVEFGGHVANFYGDCLLAYFGWPRAHEDNAERAVRAGQEVVRRVRRTTLPDNPVAVRVGVATGEVVVGDLIHEGPAREQSAVGVTPNLGARLLTLAPAGHVVIDELTRQLLPVSFALQSLGQQALKGIREPVAAYLVGDEQVAGSRFDARSRPDLAPMVGRDQELSLLLERATLARGGEGQAVLLVGEAGIGKSRVARALLDACAGSPHSAMQWQCSSYHVGSALWPVIQRLGHSAKLDGEDSAEAALDKLEALAGRSAAALYATLLGLNGTQRYGPLEMTPQMLRERTLELLTEQLFEAAEQQPILLLVEDAHWIDPTTLELLERCLDRIERARMLILVTSRPDNQPTLGAHPSVTRLSLNRLSRASVEAIVAQLSGDRLQAHTLATIVAQTDGVPLFVEELTKAVLETGEAAIPASLHGSLMARLDRVPEVKEIAQIASCIGRDFDHALLQAVAERPRWVDAALQKLVAAELVFKRGDRATPRYTFKHALVQEVAYESLLHGRRQQIHGRILGELEARGTDTPEILAHHAARANLVDKAIGYWQQAGNAALAQSAYLEATRFLESGIGLIQAQSDGIDRRGQELELQLRLGQAHVAVLGFGAQATKKPFMRAYGLLEAGPGGPSSSLRAHYGLWAWHINRSEFQESLQLAAKALAAAQQAKAESETLQCLHRLVAGSQMYLGDFARAGEHFEQALPLLDSPKRAELTAQFGVDPGVATLYYYALTLCIQGLADRSRALMARASTIGASLSQVSARAHVHVFGAMRAACQRDPATVRLEAQALNEMAHKHGLSMYGGYADVLLGWASLEPVEEAIASYERGLTRLAAVGTRNYEPFLLAGLATLLAARNRQHEALRTIDSALAQCEQHTHGWCHAELWRVRGELVQKDPQRGGDEAVGCLERAVSVAQAHGAKLWELRAANSLARLRLDQGRRVQALDLLAPIYDSFTEGFDTTDLVEARALLGELGGQPVDARHP